MTGRRIPIGAIVGVIGALLLAISLFLDWYGERSAFTVFEVLDLVLAALVIASLVALADQLGIKPAWEAIGAAAAIPLGAVALVIVITQLIQHPPGGIGEDTEIGAWLGLAGSALMLAGGVLGAAHISLAVDTREPEPSPARRHETDPDAPTSVQPPADTEATARVDTPERPQS